MRAIVPAHPTLQRILLASLALAGLAAASPLTAQIQPARTTGIRVARERGYGGFSLFGGKPTGQFADFVGTNWGIGLNVVRQIQPGAPLGIRLDGSMGFYGDDGSGEWALGFINAGFGPQLTLGRGPVRPYVFGTVGMTLFSALTLGYNEYDGDVGPIADLSNASLTLAGTMGGGMLIRATRGRRALFLDLSTAMLINGRATYETKDLGFVESGANLLVFRVGLAVSVF